MFLKKILKKVTHCSIQGEGNSIIFIANGKETQKFFMPKGLKINISGNNNKIVLEMPIKFSGTKFNICGDNNKIVIRNTKRTIDNAQIYIEDGSELYIGENASIGQGNFYLVANGNYKKSHKIIIGKNFRAGKDTVIRTSDGHSIIDYETNYIFNLFFEPSK